LNHAPALADAAYALQAAQRLRLDIAGQREDATGMTAAGSAQVVVGVSIIGSVGSVVVVIFVLL
jgi:hypothetical protein